MYLHLRMTSSAIFSDLNVHRASSVSSVVTCGVRSLDGGSEVSKMNNNSDPPHCPPQLTQGGPCASSASRSLRRPRGGASCVCLGLPAFVPGSWRVSLARLSRAVRRNGCSVCVDRLGCPPRAHAGRARPKWQVPSMRNALAYYRRDAYALGPASLPMPARRNGRETRTLHFLGWFAPVVQAQSCLSPRATTTPQRWTRWRASTAKNQRSGAACR